MNQTVRRYLPIIPALILYALLAIKLNMVQDDAFISYRYVANFLNGHGLVFNIGEFIEGYTNFGWVIFMAALGVLKLNYILLSQVVGALFGAGIIVVTFETARLLVPDNRKWFALIPTYLVAANMSLAYWAPAGLETGPFAFFAALSVYLFIRRNWLLIWSMLMAVWLRPEGAFVVGLLIVCEAVIYKRVPRFSFIAAAIAFVTSLPYVLFKLSYYGSILPNPFYAKTGFDANQLYNGIEYTLRFLQHYGFWGIGIALSLVVFARLSQASRFVWLFTALYMVYILLIGGDVLKVHRFYMPVVGGVAITSMLALWGLTRSMRQKPVKVIGVIATVLLVAVTLLSPRSFVLQYNDLEKALVRKMKFMASNMNRTDASNFSVALSTIGAFSYHLMGHKVIDLLGLTDSTIARHSEEPIPGMESTWKEAKHNSAYLLTSNPDYILFSTGIKPSAPAELALFLYPDFIKSFYMVGYYYRPEGARQGTTQSVFRRRLEIADNPQPKYSVDYVQAYKEGVEYYAARDFLGAIPYLDQALALSPDEAHAMPLYRKGVCLAYAGQHEAAQRIIDSAVAIDSFLYEGHRDLLLYAIANLDQPKAIVHRDWLMRLVPWYWPHIEQRLDADVQGDWRAFLGLTSS